MTSYNRATSKTIVLQGKLWIIRYLITDVLTGLALNVSTWAFRYTVKKLISDAIGDAKFQKVNGAGIVTTQAASGIIDVVGAAADTALLSGPHVFDFEGQAPGSDPETLDGPAEFFVRKAVTTPGVAGSPTAGPISFPNGLYGSGFRYWQDQADLMWVKERLFNRNWDIVAVSATPPPF